MVLIQLQAFEYDEKTILGKLRKFGLYIHSAEFDWKPIRVGIVNTLASRSIEDFWRRLEQELTRLGLTITRIGEEYRRAPSRAQLEECINILQKTAPHILLGFFPRSGRRDEDEEEYYQPSPSNHYIHRSGVRYFISITTENSSVLP